MKANGQKGGVGIGDTSVNIIISTQKGTTSVYFCVKGRGKYKNNLV